MRTYTIKDWDYVKHDNFNRQIQAKEFTLPNFEQIRLVAEKSKKGWMIFEVSTGLAVCRFDKWKTKKDAISAVYDNFNRYGKERILTLINSKDKI